MERSPIAIIGFGCRYPGAASPDQLWQNLVDGVESIGSPPPWRAGHFVSGQKGGFVDDVDAFDASFFKISPQDAAHMDPQQRLLLQITWSALEDAALDPGALKGSNTAVVVGMGDNEYADLMAASEDQFSVANYLGVHPSIPANRISQAFGFSGFSASVNTACSSALVAVDLACRELWLKRSQLAIAAGVNLIFDPRVTQRLVNSGWLSARGQCRSLDATADGYVRSEGVGVVVLKPVEQALADGDRIYALVQDSRIKHNGQGNGLALPCLQAQIDLLRDVYSAPGVDHADLQYVELNAVGARVGDVIELKALAAAVGRQRHRKTPLKVGSLKPNIGHSEAASGMAALIKTAMALHRKQLPPTLHYQSCDPSLDLDALGLSVVTTLEPIPPSATPALAGISALGFGGANAHILLAESPLKSQTQPQAGSHPFQVLILSAKTSSSLNQRCESFLEFICSNSTLPLIDISSTVNRSRSQLPVRLAIIAGSNQQQQARLSQALRSPHASQPGVIHHQVVPTAVPPKIGFVFTGRCVFSLDVLVEISLHYAPVREALDVCQRVLGPLLPGNLSPELEPIVGELLLHQLWQAWGITPDLCLAEPLGRTAAAIANAQAQGTSDLETALQQVIRKPNPSGPWASDAPTPSAGMGDEWLLIELGSGLVGAMNELAGLSSRSSGSGWDQLLTAAVHVSQRGAPLEWSKVCGYQHARVVSLPTYPFARERHWIGEPQLPEGCVVNDGGHRQSPATPLEFHLHNLWAEALGHSEFGVTDSFFAVGGSSLLAATLFARINEVLGIELPISVIFQAPTISRLAECIRDGRKSWDWYSLVPIQPSGERPPLFAVHLLNLRDLSDCLGDDQPVYGLRYGIGDPVAGVNLSLPGIEELASHYIDEMQRFQPDGPYFLMGHSVGGVVAYEMARQLIAKDKQVGLVAMFDSYVDLPASISETLLKFVLKNKRTLGRELLKSLKQGPRAMARGLVCNVRKLAAAQNTTLAEELHPLQIPYCPHVDNVGPAFELQRNYRPIQLPQDVIMFQAVDSVDGKSLEGDWRRGLPKAYVHYKHPEACWRRHGVKNLTVERISSGCNHMTIIFKPHAQILAMKLRRAMDAVLGFTLD